MLGRLWLAVTQRRMMRQPLRMVCPPALCAHLLTFSPSFLPIFYYF